MQAVVGVDVDVDGVNMVEVVFGDAWVRNGDGNMKWERDEGDRVWDAGERLGERERWGNGFEREEGTWIMADIEISFLRDA